MHLNIFQNNGKISTRYEEQTMTKPNGFINFNTPEDYLAYQDRLITNWEMYYKYKNLCGGTMLSETYRQTGRTYSAVKCTVELAKRQETESILFVSYKQSQADDLRKYHPLMKFLFLEYLNKINFISYSNIEEYALGKEQPDYVIYDHLVFETYDPTIVLKSKEKTPAEEAYKKLHGSYPYSCADWKIFEQAFNFGLEEGKNE